MKKILNILNSLNSLFEGFYVFIGHNNIDKDMNCLIITKIKY